MANNKPNGKKAPENETKELEDQVIKPEDLIEKSDAMEALRKENERLKKALAAERERESEVRKTDKQRVQEAIDKAVAEGRNTWDVKVPVRARPRTGTTERHYWLGVNGRFLAVPADDKYYDLPLPFAECLVNSMNAETFVKEYADREIKVYDLITNPHAEEREM